MSDNIKNDAASVRAGAGGLEPLTYGSDERFGSPEELTYAGQLRAIQAETNLVARAELIKQFRFQPRCDASRGLIRSVRGVSVTGYLVQTSLTPPVRTPSLLADSVRAQKKQFKAAYSERAKRKPEPKSKEGSLIATLTALADASSVKANTSVNTADVPTADKA